MRILILIILSLAVTVLSISLGYYLKTLPKPIPILTKQEVPLKVELLTNPLLTKIYANVEGKVIKKDINSFVLKTDRQELIIYVEEEINLSSFDKQEGKKVEKSDFNNLQPGDNVRGGINIVTDKTQTQGLKNKYQVGDIIAHNFTIIRP